MRATLPFASGGLRELAALWQADLLRPMDASERGALTARLAEVYLQILQTDPDPLERRDVADLLFALHRSVALDARLLQAVADTAEDHGDIATGRRALEYLATHEDPEIKARALERLGDVLDQLGERRAAVDSWRPAAQMRVDVPSAQAHARRLYERVLDSAPDDQDAAEHLVELYARTNSWDRIPEVFGVVVRSDADRAADLLLRLEGEAARGGALDQLAAMVDEALALRAPTSSRFRGLRQAKARALAASPARQEEAAATYRALLETPSSAKVDEDVGAYESFIATLRDPAARHVERRWLYRWRVQHGDRPADALIEWAKAEEAFGAPALAVAAYRAALDVVPAGDRPGVALRAVALLDELGSPAEAIAVLAPVLTAVPRVETAHVVAREMLGDPKFGIVVANQLECLAKAADDTSAARLLAVLLEAREETLSLPEARRRWWQSLHLRAGEMPVSLDVVLQGAADDPGDPDRWNAAETLARAGGAVDKLLRAYADTITRGALPEHVVELLGRRMIALEAESPSDTPFVAEALDRVLEGAPQAQWAFERIKVLLAREGRWTELFAAHDRAIAAAPNEDDRARLLDEAAFAARDLAGDNGRAIHYLRLLHALRPTDSRARGALERLYEREGKKLDLVGILAERAAWTDEPDREAIRRRISALWLELGRASEATDSVEAMIAEGTSVAEVVDLLEQIADSPHQGRAIERLYNHYASANAFGELVRVARRALARAEDPAEQRVRVREIVRFRLAGGPQGPQGPQGKRSETAFADVARCIPSEVRGDPRLSAIAYRGLLVASFRPWKEAKTDAAFEDAAAGAWAALGELETLVRDAAGARVASCLLERGARLRFDRPRQRALLQRAVALTAAASDQWDSDGVVENDAPRALRIITEIFRDDGGDAIAASLLGRFAALLHAAGKHEALAELWEDQARRRAGRGDREEEPACWERAAALWDRQGAAERAIAAYARGAAVGSRGALEALARLHAARGEWSEVVVALEQLRATGRERNRCSIALADAYAKLGRIEEARACLEAQLAANPPAEEIAELRDRLRIALIEEASAIGEGRAEATEDAAALLERAIALDPNDPSPRPRLADALEQLARWERLVVVCREQIALYGEHRSKERALVHQRLARALDRTGRPADALAELQNAAKMLPRHPPVLHDLARAAFEAGELELAERTYRSLLLALRSEAYDAIGSTQVMTELAEIASRKGEGERAANILESALDQAATVSERAVAACKLAEIWKGPLGRRADLGVRLRGYADTIVTELRRLDAREGLGPPWAAVAGIHAAIAEEGAFDDGAVLGILEEAIARTDGGDRAGLRFTLAKRWVGRPERAEAVIALLESTLEENPNDAEASELLASLLERERRYDALATLLERRLAKMDSASSASTSLKLRWAGILERAGRPADAACAYESILDARPSELEMARTLADRLDALRSARFADALELQIELQPDAPADLVARLVVLREAEASITGLGRTLRLLDGFAARRPGEPTLLCLRARLREVTGDWAGAVADVRAALAGGSGIDAPLAILANVVATAAEPEWTEYAFVLADVLADAHQSAREREVLERIVARHPDHEGALDRVASLAIAAGDSGRAIEAYLQLASRLEERDLAALKRVVLALADACERGGRLSDARATLERAHGALPDDADLEERLFKAYERSEDHARLSELLSARAERTTDGVARAALLLRAVSVLPAEEAASPRAIALVEQAIAADPANADAALGCAKRLMAAGRPASAALLLSETVERCRGKRHPLLGSLHLELAKAHLELDELIEAFDVLKAGFVIDPRSGAIAMLLGLLALDLDEEKTAERALLAVAMSPARTDDAQTGATDKARALYHLASLAYGRGEITKARSWAAKAAALGHGDAATLLERCAPTSLGVTPGKREARAR